MMVWKILFLSKWVISGFHFNLPECTPRLGLRKSCFIFFGAFIEPWTGAKMAQPVSGCFWEYLPAQTAARFQEVLTLAIASGLKWKERIKFCINKIYYTYGEYICRTDCNNTIWVLPKHCNSGFWRWRKSPLLKEWLLIFQRCDFPQSAGHSYFTNFFKSLGKTYRSPAG